MPVHPRSNPIAGCKMSLVQGKKKAIPGGAARLKSRIEWLKIGTVFAASFFLAIVCFGYKVRAYEYGPPASHTGAPTINGNENTCTECHASFELNSGPGNVRITGLPDTYSPNQEVPVTLTITHPQAPDLCASDPLFWGFQLTAIDGTGKAAGTFTTYDPNILQLITGTVDGNDRTYIEQTTLGTVPDPDLCGQKSWTFIWTAPDNVGPVGFYAAGNAANDDGTPEGDYIYSTSAMIMPSTGADYSITATPSSQTIAPGTNAAYTVTLTPSGGFTGDVGLSVDGLPSDSQASFNPQTVTLSDASPQSATLIVVTSATTPLGTYQLLITSTAGALQHTAMVSLVVAESAISDLSIGKTGSPMMLTVNNNLTYTITITNNGPSDATGVVMSDPLSASVTFVSANPSQGTCSGTGPVSCNIDNLSNGATATVTIVVVPSTPGQITNTASVSANETDPNPDNNTAMVVTTVAAQPTMLVPDLAVRTVVTGLTMPTSMAFLGPDDILVLEKTTGRVQRAVNGQLQTVLELPVNSFSERGLLGIALHPDFPNTPFIYLFWTESNTGAVSSAGGAVDLLGNRVDRFVWDGSTLSFDQNLIRLHAYQADAGQSLRGNHDGGVLRFGPDGKLYIIFGDNGRRSQLQNLPSGPTLTGLGDPVPDDQFGGPEPDDAHFTGVIIRLNDDGSTPADNPFFVYGAQLGGEVGANIQKIYAYGVRNSFGMAFDPLSGKLWTEENGDNAFDEINQVEPGFNGGWVQIMGPVSRLSDYKSIETSFNGLQQIRWPPNRIANTPEEALQRLFMLPGAHYEDPKFSWKYAVAPSPIGFINGDGLGAQYAGDLFVGAARTTLAGGYLFHFKLTDDRQDLVLDAPGLEDRVADNLAKFDITESESLLIGRDFGITTDIQTGPNGHLYLVSLSNGEIYEIYGQWCAPKEAQRNTHDLSSVRGVLSSARTRAGHEEVQIIGPCAALSLGLRNHHLTLPRGETSVQN